MKERKMVDIMLFDDGTYEIEDVPSYRIAHRYYGVVDGKPCIGQICKKDKWRWHLRKLISWAIKDNNKKISKCKKENACLEKLKNELEVEE